MDIIAVIFLWPFILLAAGLVFVAFFDTLDYGSSRYAFYGLYQFFWWFILFFIILIVVSKKKRKSLQQLSYLEQLLMLRKLLVIFSIASLFPIFIRYLVSAFHGSLPIVIFSLIIGFALIVWGIFVRHHATIMYSNIIGGALALFYLYTQLWDLGEGARIIAAGFGLAVAVGVSVIKLKDKLT